MSYLVSQTLREAIYRNQTERVFIILISISHPQLSDTLRYTSDGRDTVHMGNTYQPVGFSIALPDDKENVQPRASIMISNVDLRIVQTLRTIQEPPTFGIKLVLDDDPDRIERGPWEMELVNLKYDINTVSGEIRSPSLLSEPFPANTYNVIDYLGL